MDAEIPRVQNRSLPRSWQSDDAVYFRGQARERGEMRAGLFRKVATSATADSRTRQLQDYIK